MRSERFSHSWKRTEHSEHGWDSHHSFQSKHFLGLHMTHRITERHSEVNAEEQSPGF